MSSPGLRTWDGPKFSMIKIYLYFSSEKMRCVFVLLQRIIEMSLFCLRENELPRIEYFEWSTVFHGNQIYL